MTTTNWPAGGKYRLRQLLELGPDHQPQQPELQLMHEQEEDGPLSSDSPDGLNDLVGRGASMGAGYFDTAGNWQSYDKDPDVGTADMSSAAVATSAVEAAAFAAASQAAAARCVVFRLLLQSNNIPYSAVVVLCVGHVVCWQTTWV